MTDLAKDVNSTGADTGAEELSKPMTIGPFCQFQPPVMPPNTPLESIDVLDCEKSKLAAAPPKVPPIHQPAKRFGDTGGGASERSGGGPSLMTSALRTGLETAALAVNAAAKARA